MKSDSSRTRALSSSSLPGLSLFVAMKMNGPEGIGGLSYRALPETGVAGGHVEVTRLQAVLRRLGVRGVDLRASRHKAPGLKDRESVADVAKRDHEVVVLALALDRGHAAV